MSANVKPPVVVYRKQTAVFTDEGALERPEVWVGKCDDPAVSVECESKAAAYVQAQALVEKAQAEAVLAKG